MSAEVFRANVGVLVIDGHGRVLALERVDVPGSWQAPQGGIDRDEQPIEAAARELAEETGIAWSDVTVVAEHEEWLAYELPPSARSPRTGRGQVQRWFLVRYSGDDNAIDLGAGDAEFGAWRWTSMRDLVAETWEVRRPTYARLAEAWREHLA